MTSPLVPAITPVAPSQLRVDLFPASARLLADHQKQLPQKDELCGPFWALLALGAAGVTGGGGQPLDQDEVALQAGSLITKEPLPEDLPPGEAGRRDYRLELAVAEDVSVSGTSARGVQRAIETLSGGVLAAVPITGTWTADRIRATIAAAHDADALLVVANVRTGPLWHSRPSPGQVMAYLGGEPQAVKGAEWDVGHFVGVLGTIHGPGDSLALVSDTYPSLGWRGVYAQPMDRLAAALLREGDPAGVLVVAAESARDGVIEAAAAAGLENRLWDNGSFDAMAS
jgi:hypothetical protein